MSDRENNYSAPTTRRAAKGGSGGGVVRPKARPKRTRGGQAQAAATSQAQQSGSSQSDNEDISGEAGSDTSRTGSNVSTPHSQAVSNSSVRRSKRQRTTSEDQGLDSNDERPAKASNTSRKAKLQIRLREVIARKSKASNILQYLAYMTDELENLTNGHKFLDKTRDEYKAEVIDPLNKGIKALFMRTEGLQEGIEAEVEVIQAKLKKKKK
eukprot:Nk52_evm22s2192 gene=Nk52_evmTU22s2192